MELKDRVIHVEGSVVGYQFAKKSMGSRTFKGRTVNLPADNGSIGTVYIPLLKREVCVRRLVTGYDWHWEAIK